MPWDLDPPAWPCTTKTSAALAVHPGIARPTWLDHRHEASMFSGASEDEECVSRILPEKLKLQLLRSCSLILDWNIRWRTVTALLFENHGDTAMCWERH